MIQAERIHIKERTERARLLIVSAVINGFDSRVDDRTRTNVDRKEVCFQSECPQSGEMVVSASPKIYLQRVYTALKAFKGKQRSYLSLSLRWGVRVVAIPHFMQAC